MFSIIDHKKYDKICRTCLHSNENLMSLYKPEILKMLSVCTAINVDENDGFPNQICPICFQKALDAYNFHKLCEKSDQLLRENQLNINEQNNCDDLIKDEEIVETEKTSESVYVKDEIIDDIKEENSNDEEILNDEDVTNDDNKNKTNLTCSECGKQFRFNYELNRHGLTHKTATIPCEECDKKYKTNEGLELHIKTCHSGDRPLQICKICGKSVLHLNRHNVIHSDKKFTCTACSIDFTNRSALRMHINRRHGKNMDPTKYKPCLCSICGKKTYSITTLNAHMIKHTSERKYTCELCSKPFKTRDTLKKHVRFIHEAIKNVQCHICEKSFCSTSVLKLHLRVHTGERPYQCHVCLKTFSQTSSLRTHIKVHGTPINDTTIMTSSSND